MKLDAKLIGIRIMQRRKALGYTQERLSELVDVSKNHISSIERGVCFPTTQFILKICEVLGETPDYYLIGKVNMPNEGIMDLIKSLHPKSQDILFALIETYIGKIHET